MPDCYAPIIDKIKPSGKSSRRRRVQLVVAVQGSIEKFFLLRIAAKERSLQIKLLIQISRDEKVNLAIFPVRPCIFHNLILLPIAAGWLVVVLPLVLGCLLMLFDLLTYYVPKSEHIRSPRQVPVVVRSASLQSSKRRDYYLPPSQTHRHLSCNSGADARANPNDMWRLLMKTLYRVEWGMCTEAGNLLLLAETWQERLAVDGRRLAPLGKLSPDRFLSLVSCDLPGTTTIPGHKRQYQMHIFSAFLGILLQCMC